VTPFFLSFFDPAKDSAKYGGGRVQPLRGYRDSARLLGESCTKKIEVPMMGHPGKKLFRNQEIVVK